MLVRVKLPTFCRAHEPATVSVPPVKLDVVCDSEPAETPPLKDSLMLSRPESLQVSGQPLRSAPVPAGAVMSTVVPLPEAT